MKRIIAVFLVLGCITGYIAYQHQKMAVLRSQIIQLSTQVQDLSNAFAKLDKPSFVGISSWYGKAHQGLTMANGQPFDRFKYTAAHRTLPHGTKLFVYYPKTKKGTVVTVTDRGPYTGKDAKYPKYAKASNRVLDVAECAAKDIGLGCDKVQIWIGYESPVSRRQRGKAVASKTPVRRTQPSASINS